MIRGWDLILPRCGETSTLARGATLDARWFTEPQSAIAQRGWDFHTVRSGIVPGDLRFRPWVVRFVKIWNDF